MAEVLVELLIVIVGVFVRIQASNWNDQRLEREQGRQIAERLLADLRIDVESRIALVRYYQAVFDRAVRTVSRLDARTVDDPTAFVVDAYRATEYAHRPPTRAAFDEMVSSGNLGLVPEEAREAGLIAYFRSDISSATRDGVLASPYRARVRRVLTYEIQAAIRAHCSDVHNEKGTIIRFNDTCEMGVPLEELQNAAAALHSDSALAQDLRLHFSVLYSQMPVFQGEVVKLQSSIHALEAALSSGDIGP